MGTTRLSENNQEYFLGIYKQISTVLSNAYKEHIDLTLHYPRENKGFQLQADLDHIGADLNMGMYGMISNSVYQEADGCLALLEAVLKKGLFCDHMKVRRKNIKQRHTDSKRVTKILDELIASL